MAKYLRSICLLVAMVLLIAVQRVHGRTMWGARKKKGTEEKARVVEESLQPKVFDNVEDLLGDDRDSSFPSQASAGRGARKKKGLNAADFMGSETLSAMVNTMEEYFTMMEGVLDSPEMESVYSIDDIRKTLEGMSAFLPSDMEDLLSIEDPSTFRKMAKRGLETMRESVRGVSEAMDNPIAMQSLLDTLPPDLSEFLEAVASGDKKRAAKFIDKLPSKDSFVAMDAIAAGKAFLSNLVEDERLIILADVDESLKSLLIDMVLGKTDSLQSQMAGLLQDPDQIEAARLHMLENMAMAKAMGFSEDVIMDPEKWRALVEEGLGELNLDGSADLTRPPSNKHRNTAATRVGAA